MLSTAYGREPGQHPYLCFLAELRGRSLQLRGRAGSVPETHRLPGGGEGGKGGGERAAGGAAAS